MLLLPVVNSEKGQKSECVETELFLENPVKLTKELPFHEWTLLSLMICFKIQNRWMTGTSITVLEK